MEEEKEFEKRFVKDNYSGLLYMIDPDIENPEETAKAHLEIIVEHWLRPNLAKEKQLSRQEVVEEIKKMGCPEKCSQGHIFLGYGGESGEEENWDSCPVCVKRDAYNPVVSISDIDKLIQLKDKEI